MAEECKPLLNDDVEWGYVEYIPNPESDPNAYVTYYRAYFYGNAIEDGVEYMKVKWGNTFDRDRKISAVSALMREEKGKVYVRYIDEGFVDPCNYFSVGEEFLLYDFTMNEGDFLTFPLKEGESEGIVLKCVETGMVETKAGMRRYWKFDRNVNETTREYMAFEYIIEGIGPVGNCSFVVPFRAASMQNESAAVPNVDFLYQRSRLRCDEDNIQPQGEMLYVSPMFDVMGPYDPSVWFWQRLQETNNYQSSVETPIQDKLPDWSISMLSEGFDDKVIVSKDENLTEVVVYDVIGKMLAKYQPYSREFKFDMSRIDSKILIVRASTAKGSRSFKVIK